MKIRIDICVLRNTNRDCEAVGYIFYSEVREQDLNSVLQGIIFKQKFLVCFVFSVLKSALSAKIWTVIHQAHV